jgi:glycosyltransferase involved in cell wall biosynthesis
MSKVSAYVIAYNDELNMRACLESVGDWAAELIVVDSHSSDRTADIAQEFTDKVYQVDFQGFGALWNQAVSYCSHEWIFSLDTDERMTPGFVPEWANKEGHWSRAPIRLAKC